MPLGGVVIARRPIGRRKTPVLPDGLWSDAGSRVAGRSSGAREETIEGSLRGATAISEDRWRSLDHFDAGRADAMNLDDRAFRASPSKVGHVRGQIVVRSRRQHPSLGLISGLPLADAK